MTTALRFIPQLVVLMFLCLASVQRGDLVTESSTHGYHARVRAVSALPVDLPAEWKVRDIPLTEEEARLLLPNVFIHRQFTDKTSGDVLEMIFIQSSDSRALINHYPPNCYRNQGLNLVHSESADQIVGHTTLTGTQYTFTSSRFGHYYSEVVFNCFLLPNGKIIRDMDGYVSAATSAKLRPYGAAELQIITDEVIPETERNELFERLLSAYQPLLEATGTGTTH